MSSIDLQENYDFGCSNSTESADEILLTYCTSTSIYSPDSLHCDKNASVNYLCPLLDPDTSPSLNVTAQEALLAGSRFDQNRLTEFVRDAVYNVSDHSVDSLYPS